MAKAKDPEVAREQEATDEQLEKEREVSTQEQGGGRQKQSKEDFRAQQKAQAASQGLTSDRAVPESRDPAYAQSNAEESELTKRQRESGVIDPEPMPQSAYDSANDESRMKKTAKDGLTEALHVSDYIKVVDEGS